MFAHRRTVMLLAIVGVVPAFAGTHALVARSRDARDRRAAESAERGVRDLEAKRPGEAADAFRIAMENAREPDRYRLPLAQALIGAGRRLEARAQLETLWNERPGDGLVNLELGRLAAADGDAPAAVRYYHAAIDGAWDSDEALSRRAARIELAEFLFRSSRPNDAEPEIVALLSERPLDPRVARIAGIAAYRNGDYRTAHDYLTSPGSDAIVAGDAEASRARRVSARAIALDPYARGIHSRERLRRIVAAFDVAKSAAERCGGALADEAASAAPQANERTLARDPDAADAMLALVARVEAAAGACGALQDDDLAVQLVLRGRRISS